MKKSKSKPDSKAVILQDHNIYDVMENSGKNINADTVDALPDEIEMAKRVMSEQDEQDTLDEQIRSNNLKNVTLTDADLHLFGDRTVLAQVTQLLSYIRHALKNNAKTELVLTICDSDDTVANAEFMFDVNGYQVPDCVTQPKWWIN